MQELPLKQELPLNHPILIITTRIHGTPPTHISIHAMMFLLTHLHPHDPLCLSACLPVCLSACLSVCLPACLFSQGHVIPSYPPSPSRSPLPVCLPVCLSACLSVCLSACFLRATLFLLTHPHPHDPLCLSVCLSFQGHVFGLVLDREEGGHDAQKRWALLSQTCCQFQDKKSP